MQKVQVDEEVEAGYKEPLRIAQLLSAGGQWGDITPETMDKGLGGRETAVIRLGQEWAKMGHHVDCFVPTSSPASASYPSGGRIDFIDVRAARVMLGNVDRDVLVTWESPELLGDPRIVSNVRAILVGMQVAHLDLDSDQAQMIDRIVCLSEWASDFLYSQLGDMFPRDRYVSIPNGIDLSLYPNVSNDHLGVRRKTGFFFYSSSPDRGLHHLLRMWPRMRKEINSHAVLHVAYGAERWVNEMVWAHNMVSEIALQIRDGLQQPGVVSRGLMTKKELAHLQLQSAMLPYTADTLQPTETGCITVTEAMAAKAPVLTTDCDCLPSEYAHAAMIHSLPINDDDYLEKMDFLLRDTDAYCSLQEEGRVLAEERTWELTSLRWVEVMREVLREQESPTMAVSA